jgi:hypothetical protein
VVDRPRKHARKLGLPDPRFERLDLPNGVALRRFVVLGDAKLEVLAGIGELRADLRDQIDLALYLGPLAQEFLRCDLIVPEAGNAGAIVQLGQAALEARDVKDAPLAPGGAF